MDSLPYLKGRRTALNPSSRAWASCLPLHQNARPFSCLGCTMMSLFSAGHSFGGFAAATCLILGERILTSFTFKSPRLRSEVRPVY